MSLESVMRFFEGKGISERVLQFPVSSATVDLAAQALGVVPGRIGKTLSFQNQEGCILVVVAGDAKVNSSKFKAVFGVKPKMLTPEQVVYFTGHAVGGVCPFAIEKSSVEVYTDLSLQRFETVFPACGNGHSAIELTCSELFHHANSLKWVDVCVGWQEEQAYGFDKH